MPSIPAHGLSGLLPPFIGSATDLLGRSPYEAPLEEVIDRFATSHKRKAILEGFLNYRAALRVEGFTRGFQWLDGSFVEVMSREPNDIDVVTFTDISHVPMSDPDAVARARKLFDSTETKKAYLSDAYLVQLKPNTPEQLVRSTHYWYSLFSHRRDASWKGIIQVALSNPDNDVAASTKLTAVVLP